MPTTNSLAPCYPSDAFKASTALRQRLASSRHVGCVPVGYRAEYRDGEWRAVIDGKKAPAIREAFLLAGQGMPIRSILRELAGMRSVRGRRVGPSSLWVILTNPFYAGWLRYHAGLAPALHPAIVTKDEFDWAQGHMEIKRMKWNGVNER